MKDPLRDILKRSKKQVSLFSRLGAYFVDILLINFAVMYPFSSFLDSFSDLSSFNMTVFFVLLFVVALTWAYWVVCDYYFSQTLGKMLFGLRVRGKKKKLTFKQVFMRNLTKPFSVLLLIDSWKLFLRGGRQRYTEEVSQTWVESV